MGGCDRGSLTATSVRGLLGRREVYLTEPESGNVPSIKALARREGLCNHYTARLLPLAYLAPDIAETILAGRQGYGVSLAGLTAQPLPFSWSAQRDLVRQLGMRAG